MIAIDTNLLVYAHRADSEWHGASLELMRGLADGRAPWAIPWPCVHEFLAIVTHPRIYAPPSTLDSALASLRAWLDSPTCSPIGEGPGYFELLGHFVLEGHITGGMIHDAQVAAICMHNGVSILWTSDRDFSRFPKLVAVNPLVSGKPTP